MVEITDELTEAAWVAFRDSDKPAPYNQIKDALRAVAPLIEAQARGEMERLTRERDEWREACLGHGDKAGALRSRMDEQSDELSTMRAALQQIADMGPMAVDDQRWRIARQVLTSPQKPEHPAGSSPT